MCGIAGMYTFKKNNLQTDYFKWCLTTMRHRGPDAQGLWDNGTNYITAFTRLAIRDVSPKGNQPMLSDCSKYCISFNGEIYNTDVLTQLLKPYRTGFYSTSDTELLLYALIHLGTAKTLEVADGIFAFAFYDASKNKLTLARDRVGVKPLYIGTSDDGIVYSSQYDHIINHTFCKQQAFDENAVASYLSLGYMAENAGIITNTKLLPHGYYYEIANGIIDEQRYYNYCEDSSNINKPSLLDSIIERSVSSQLVSDVSVGTFMSGGVDSTLVSYFAGRHTNLKSFTLGINDSITDESKSAAEFAHLFKLNNACKKITSSDLLSLLNDNAKAFSEPFADYSSLPTLMLSGFAKQQVTVALSGDGGDELFWGYPRSIKALNFIPYYQEKLWPRRISLLKDKLKNRSSIELLRHWKQADFMEYYFSSLSITGAIKWLPQIFKVKPASPFFFEECKAMFNGEQNDAEQLMLFVRKLEVDIHLQRILLKVDRASMYHSLEVRVPLLSNAMLQHSLSCRYDDCINNNIGKMNLKKSLSYKANPELAMQQKKGFVIPMDAWMRKEIKNEITEKIMNMPLHLSTMFNRKKVEQLLSAHMNGTENRSWFIWAIYCLVIWDATHRNKL